MKTALGHLGADQFKSSSPCTNKDQFFKFGVMGFWEIVDGPEKTGDSFEQHR